MPEGTGAEGGKRRPFDVGLVGDGLPAVRLGQGSEALVMFPPLSDALGDIRGAVGYLARHYRNYASRYEFWIVGRRHELPQGYTTRDMAADYAKAMDEDIGAAHVVGVSLGGMVAQHLAHDRPDLVQKLVLCAAPARAGREAQELFGHWKRLAEAGQWKDYYRQSARASFTGWRRGIYAAVFGWLGRPPQFPQDLMVSIDAALAHDGEEALRALKAETLVTGGTADPVFPPYLMQDTADMIPGAEFELYEGGGHAALDQYRKEFEPLLLRFLHRGAKPA